MKKKQLLLQLPVVQVLNLVVVKLHRVKQNQVMIQNILIHPKHQKLQMMMRMKLRLNQSHLEMIQVAYKKKRRVFNMVHVVRALLVT